MNKMKYAVVIEKGENSNGAHVPDLPGCIAVGESRKAVLRLIREAIDLHVQGLIEQGDQVPLPSSSVEYVDVAAQQATQDNDQNFACTLAPVIRKRRLSRHTITRLAAMTMAAPMNTLGSGQSFQISQPKSVDQMMLL